MIGSFLNTLKAYQSDTSISDHTGWWLCLL